jgi:crotonobetainyl-CoA:carnitine CoA-transferase CaiB-like acyl-CoA transferase
MIVETEHPRFGTIRQMRSPVRVGAGQPDYARAPFRAEHQDLVLRDLLGYDDVRIQALRSGGAFGQAGPL